MIRTNLNSKQMKALLFSFAILLTGSLFSQKVKETISTKTIGGIKCTYTKTTEPNKAESYLLHIDFNEGFSVMATVLITNKADLENLVSDLSNALSSLNSPKIKSEVITYERPLYTIILDGEKGTIEVMDIQRKHCFFGKNHLGEFLNYVKAVTIP